MAKVGLPIADKAIPISPHLPPSIPVSDEMRQTLALLLGYAYGDRVPIQASPSGILRADGPRLVDVFHWTAGAANDPKQGSDVPCSEVLCMGHPDNGSKVWVRTKSAATVNNALPLDANDVIGFSVDNLSELQALIVANGEKLIVGYCQ